MYSYTCRVRKIAPSSTVRNRPVFSCPRFSFIMPQWAQVSVAPELSRISVLIAGIPHAAIGVKGSSTTGPALGQAAEKPGHKSELSASASHGRPSTRT